MPEDIGSHDVPSKAVVDASPGEPDLFPDDLPAAEAAVGKSETIDQMLAERGISGDGTFVEEGDVKQIGEEGRLTATDEAAIEASQRTVEQADAYSKALDAAVRCII